MAQLTELFNPLEVPPNCGGIPFPVSGPDGIRVIIVSDEIKQNSKKDGGFLRINFEAIEGDAKGARIPWHLNLYHTNPVAVNIARGHLSAIAHCIGQFDPFSDTTILHNRPLRIVTKLQAKEKADEPDRAEIVGVLTADGQKPGKVANPAFNAPPAFPPVAQAAPAFPPAFPPVAQAAPAMPFNAPPAMPFHVTPAPADKMPWEV